MSVASVRNLVQQPAAWKRPQTWRKLQSSESMGEDGGANGSTSVKHKCLWHSVTIRIQTNVDQCGMPDQLREFTNNTKVCVCGTLWICMQTQRKRQVCMHVKHEDKLQLLLHASTWHEGSSMSPYFALHISGQLYALTSYLRTLAKRTLCAPHCAAVSLPSARQGDCHLISPGVRSTRGQWLQSCTWKPPHSAANQKKIIVSATPRDRLSPIFWICNWYIETYVPNKCILYT